MVRTISDDQLREMAQHRGLKLVRSRRRKAGLGDYGKYGLTDATGKPLLGIGDQGLTANAEQIQEYLRSSELGTWKQSAELTPDRPIRSKVPRVPTSDEESHPIRTRSKLRSEAKLANRDHTSVDYKRDRKPRSAEPLKLVPKTHVEPELKPAKLEAGKDVEPALRVRAATAGDAFELSTLLNTLGGVNISQREVTRNLAKSSKAQAGMTIALLGEVIGCCGWAVLPTVHRGMVGRLTVLIVDRNHRRKGVATALLAAAEKALIKAGCRQVEAMSDIAIANSHNFFRSLGFEQTSYRFARRIGD